MNTFENLYDYEPNHLHHYMNYANRYPNLSSSEVVWQVNCGLYLPFDKKVEIINNSHQFPILVNKYYRLPKTFIPEKLQIFPQSDYQATNDTVEAFLKLQHAAKLEDYHLSVLSAYRSYDYRQQLYEDYVKADGVELADTYSARPGHSEHQTGYALDICETGKEMERFEGTKEAIWLANHVHEYRFIIRYPQGVSHLTGYQYEPWHITYVGVEVSQVSDSNT